MVETTKIKIGRSHFTIHCPSEMESPIWEKDAKYGFNCDVNKRSERVQRLCEVLNMDEFKTDLKGMLEIIRMFDKNIHYYYEEEDGVHCLYQKHPSDKSFHYPTMNGYHEKHPRRNDKWAYWNR